MRKMKNECGSINVVEHVILRNYWEYYITDDKYSDDIVRALVLGDETELGDISLNEIKPYIVSRSRKIDMMPAPGWQWEE